MKKIDLGTVLVTGAAGFIGAALSRKLLKEGISVVGVDNLNDYYDVSLKKSRLNYIAQALDGSKKKLWNFYQISIENKNEIDKIFNNYAPSVVVNLAAQAGVRYSIDNPISYFNSNLLGFGNILEACRNYKVTNLVYASSSSVYGGNKKTPFKEKHPVDHQVSLYAATKRSNELMANSYSHLYGIPATGLRFFTVYGPWGRPDMAPMIFVNSILSGKVIKVFNYGDSYRDFTFIDDVVEAIYRCCLKPASPNTQFDIYNPDPSSSKAPHRIFNLGCGKPVNLLAFIELIESNLKIKAKKEFLPLQKGDVEYTSADITALNDWIGYEPNYSIDSGILEFINWFRRYYRQT